MSKVNELKYSRTAFSGNWPPVCSYCVRVPIYRSTSPARGPSQCTTPSPHPPQSWDHNMRPPVPQPIPIPLPYMPLHAIHSNPPAMQFNPCVPPYYLPYPATYSPASYSMYGGVLWERSAHPPVYAPTPVYPKRRRAMTADSENPDAGIADIPQQEQGSGVTSAKKPLRNNANEQKLNEAEANDMSNRSTITISLLDDDDDHPSNPSTPASSSPAKDRYGYVIALDNKQPSVKEMPTGNAKHLVKHLNPIVKEDKFHSLPSTSTDNTYGSSPIASELKNQEPDAEKTSTGKVKLSKLVLNEHKVSKQANEGLGVGVNPPETQEIATIEINIPHAELYNMLMRHVPSKEQLKNMGFPLMSMENPKIAVVFKQDVRASFIQKNNKNADRKWTKRAFESNEKTCVRCGKSFYVKGATYLTTESCTYHWGKMKATDSFRVVWACCDRNQGSEGCETSRLHVWSGLSEGLNHMTGFVSPSIGKRNKNEIFSIDCEMVYTKAGMEVVKVVLINVFSEIVYQSLVRPLGEVIDYNTRFSGISLDDMLCNCPKPFHDVRKDLLQYIKADTIIIGHSLENDLRVLKIVHPLVVDTTVIYPHPDGFPLRRSLKDLAQEVLGQTIQTKASGHDPAEDAKTALALVLLKIQKEHDESNK